MSVELPPTKADEKITLPPEIMEKAFHLRNSVKAIYIALYTAGKPCTAGEIAGIMGHARAYISMRLNQLEDMKLIQSHSQGRNRIYEIVK